MEYHGKLYGKFGGTYFDTIHTTDEWDSMVKAIQEKDQIIRDLTQEVSALKAVGKGRDTELAIEQLKQQGSYKVLVVKPATEIPPPSTESHYRLMGYSDPYFGIGQSPSRERFLVIAQYYFPRGEWRSIQVGMQQLLEYYVEG